jgi:hypothetical protein
MTEISGAYHEAVAQNARANKLLVRVGIVALAVLVAVAVGVFVWSTTSLGVDVALIKSRQLQFHKDTQAQDVALAKAEATDVALAKTVSCQSGELHDILGIFYQAQQAAKNHTAQPTLVLSKPC